MGIGTAIGLIGALRTKTKKEITEVKNAIQLTSDFVGDPDTDIGHHSEPITTDIINMTPGTSTEHDVTFTLTKEKIKVNGTADANFYKDLQSVTLEAGKTYTLTIGSPITIDGFFIMLYQGSTVLANFKKANGNYTYTVTPVSDISAVLKAYCAKTYNLNNYEKTISLTVSGTQNVGNTVAEAVHNLRSDKTYYVDASGAEMLVMCKMPGASNKDVGVKMKTFTNNNTYSFCSFGTVDNDTPYVSDDPSDYVEYQSTGEDWFSPCKVYADNDADGDYPAATNFSGGFHRIDSKDTSRRISLDILIDGKDQPGFVGYCNTIDITVVHQLVASNTFKTDGTGREVLKETVKMHFENGRIDVETTFEALEAVTLKVWYFIQGHHKADGLGSDGVRYIGSDANRGITSMDENSNAGDLYGRVMRFLSDTLQMDMEIKYFDAGRFNHNTQSSSGFVSFYTTYSKAYFNAVNDTTTGVSLAEGDTITARGSYRFGMFE